MMLVMGNYYQYFPPGAGDRELGCIRMGLALLSSFFFLLDCSFFLLLSFSFLFLSSFLLLPSSFLSSVFPFPSATTTHCIHVIHSCQSFHFVHSIQSHPIPSHPISAQLITSHHSSPFPSHSTPPHPMQFHAIPSHAVHCDVLL